MDPAVRQALENDLTVDITTTGRSSGGSSRIEIWMLHIDGRFFITGTPGPRDWFANLGRDARLVVHLKQAVNADVAATARVVVDPGTRRWLFEHDAASWYRGQVDTAELVASAPMVELTFVD